MSLPANRPHEFKPMSPRARVQIALEGGKPDRVPIYPIFDMGYLARLSGGDDRHWRTASPAERLAAIEKSFLRHSLSAELQRQIEGAGRDGAFIVGTPIMPPNANPDAVDFYFSEARRLGKYP